MARRKSKKTNSLVLKIAVMAVVLIALIVSVVFFEPQINELFGWQKSYSGEQTVTGDGAATNIDSIDGKELIIHYIDVGQGDCTMIELPSGNADKPKLMLIDGGLPEEKQKAIDYIDSIFPTLKTDNDFYFEYVVLTHPDNDHSGALGDLIKRYGAKYIYRPNVKNAIATSDPASSKTGRNGFWGTPSQKSVASYNYFLEQAYKSTIVGSEVIVNVSPQLASADDMQKRLDVFDGNNDGDFDDDEDCVIRFWSPLSQSYKSWNDYSPVMTVDYLSKRALFSGDAEQTAEKEFVQKYKNTGFAHCDIIKLGHHGSKTSSSEDFLSVITDQSKRSSVLGIVSCGLNNSYKHPSSEVFTRWNKLGFDEQNILRTDLSSTIVLSITIDSDNGEYIIMSGTTKIRTVQKEPFRWLYAAIIVGVVVFVLLFLLNTKTLKAFAKKRR